MRRSKQILMTVLITFILLTLAWFAGKGRTSEKMIQVVAAKCAITAGSQLTADQLTIVHLPGSAAAECQITDLSQTIGQWSTISLDPGELLSCGHLSPNALGLEYPNPGPGRRLLTISLNPADANGYWLAAGSRIDLHLIPRDRERVSEMKILENIRVMAVIDGNMQAGDDMKPTLTGDQMLCLDLDVEQARLINSAPGIYDIRLAVINEKPVTQKNKG